jgi:hypothetical protein
MVAEKFRAILAKERIDELMLFLRSLDKEGKKAMALAMKELSKEYLEYKQVNSLIGTSFKQKASPLQVTMLQATGLVCLNRKEYQKLDAFNNMLDKDILENVLSIYCPDWFSDLVNDLTKQEWMPWQFTYHHAIALAEKGFLNPTDELIARLIPQMIFQQGTDHKHLYVPQNLERKAITLEKHIWLIFQFETNINFSDRFYRFENQDKEERRWMSALRHYTGIGLMDRQRLLKESILATCRNFNKGLSGWFVDLFEFMEPTRQELLILQPELMVAMSSPHSKAVNTALNSFKEIVAEKEFNIRGLLENAPILLSSETKSVVLSTLLLFEKLIRKEPFFKENICLATCLAFIHNDENIQNKASKLLIRFHDRSMVSVATEISRYSDSMLMSSRKLLAEFITDKSGQKEISFSDSSYVEKTFQPIQTISSLDDVIFLASQAFDNNDPLHIDLLPAAFVNFQDQLTGSTLHKFEPALQRAYSFVINDWPSTMGYLDHMLATFFIDLTKLLIERYPAEGSSLNQIHGSFKKKDDENKAKWKGYVSRIPELVNWSPHSRDNTYIIYKSVLRMAYEKIKAGEAIPILSTPTHEQGYVDPLTLVRRMAIYREKNVLPENYDFQLAISRVAPFHHEIAVKEAREKLKDETLRIMEFLLDKNADPMPPFTTPSLWFMAAVTKSPLQTFPAFHNLFYSKLPKSIFTGDVPWRSFTEHFTMPRYNFEKKKQEEVPARHNVLRLTLAPSPSIWQVGKEKSESVLSKLVKFISGPKKNRRDEVYTLYELLSLKSKWISAEHNDIQRFVQIFPSNPNPVLALVASRTLTHSTLSSEIDKRMTSRTLEALIKLKFHFSEMTHLFIASCMLTSDKTIRSFAAELWINAVSEGHNINAEIGKIVGVHLSAEYAPMKRFTDLIQNNLLKISPSHNIALEEMVSSIIENLPLEPPMGAKRLLELYSEILASNNSSVKSDQLRKRLSSWSSSSGLKKLVASVSGEA